MPKIVINVAPGVGKPIGLETRRQNPIQNEQVVIITLLEKRECDEWDKKYPSVMFVRNLATPVYNCHGLTFASRRTVISESKTIIQILDEDDYFEISRAAVRAGDIMMYVEIETGDFVHSGIVVNEIPLIEGANSIEKEFVIISKWGKYKEVIHMANNCPYSPVGAKFYRIRG